MKQPSLLPGSIIISLLFFFLSTFAGAESSAATRSPQKQVSRYTISEISFDGLQTVKESELLNNIPLKQGGTVSIPGPEIPGTIEYLWKQKKFSDIQAEQNISGQTAALRFIVVELPILDRVVFNGNDKIKDRELNTLAALYPGRHIDEQSLLTAAENIRKTYSEKGYLRADVSFDLKPTGNNRAEAVFTIDENTKVIIEKIRFHGNDSFKDGKLRGVFKETHQNAWWKTIFGQPKLDREEYNQDKKLLIGF